MTLTDKRVMTLLVISVICLVLSVAFGFTFLVIRGNDLNDLHNRDEITNAKIAAEAQQHVAEDNAFRLAFCGYLTTEARNVSDPAVATAAKDLATKFNCP